jgi:glycosyltransferase involved in cell wall biosynthesis
MNILFLLRYIDSGGITRVVIDSSNFLINRGHKVFIIYGKFLEGENSFKTLLESNPNIKLIELKGLSLEFSSFLILPISIFKYLYNIYINKINIVHLHWLSLSFLCFFSKKIFNTPFVTTTHLINKSRKVFPRFYSNCNISISSEISIWLRDVEGVSSKKIYQVYNSVNEAEFPYFPYHQRQLNKEKFGFKNTLILLCLARFENIKRHDIIINALSNLKNVDFILFLAGEGVLFEKVKNMVINRNLTDKVKFVGHVDPREILSFSDIILLTSDQEGFPMSIIEAMSSGVVPIRTNSEGAYDQIIDGFNGFLINKGSSEQLTIVLKKIVEDISQLQILSKNANHYALENFNHINNQNKILEFYELLNSRRILN